MKEHIVISPTSAERIRKKVYPQLRDKEFTISALKKRIQSLGHSSNYSSRAAMTVLSNGIERGQIVETRVDDAKWFEIRI